MPCVIPFATADARPPAPLTDIYDRAGCGVNAPAAYRDGVFDSCEGDDQLFPGVYVENGATMTWTQPPEGQAIGQ